MPSAATSVRNFKSKSGTRTIELLVPLCFRSSCQGVLRRITNFGNGALEGKRFKIMNVHQSNLMRGMMLIGGELVPSEGGEWLESVNPATEETLGHVPHGTAADVNRAVAAAEAAHPAWAALEPKERAKLVKKLAAKLRERSDEILRIEVVDTGNTIAKMRADVASAGDTHDFYAGFSTEIKGETIPASAKNLHFTIREPYGVVGDRKSTRLNSS